MDNKEKTHREGSLEAPKRNALDWQNPDFYNEQSLLKELDRVFDICHGCRRCFNLCNAFPTLFDAIDESESMELDSVDKKVYWQVIDHCYLCDICFMTKCPYVPPHPWNVDFPKLMLRGKAVKHKQGKTKLRDKVLTSTDAVGKLASIPVVAQTANTLNQNKTWRKVLGKTLGVHPEAHMPEYRRSTARQAVKEMTSASEVGKLRGKVAIFSTCYGEYNEPALVEDLVHVFQHNNIAVTLAEKTQCCGMPKLELGDMQFCADAVQKNVKQLKRYVDSGWDIIAPVPSCVLMLRMESALFFPNDEDVRRVAAAVYDPFEYLLHYAKAGKLKTEFKNRLGSIAYHAPCHLRAQNIGSKTRDVLQLVPDTTVKLIERCSGHNGTYAVKKEYHNTSMKIGKPLFNQVKQMQAEHYSSDCPMAGHQMQLGTGATQKPEHPMALLRYAYGL